MSRAALVTTIRASLASTGVLCGTARDPFNLRRVAHRAATHPLRVNFPLGVPDPTESVPGSVGIGARVFRNQCPSPSGIGARVKSERPPESVRNTQTGPRERRRARSRWRTSRANIALPPASLAERRRSQDGRDELVARESLDRLFHQTHITDEAIVPACRRVLELEM